VEGKATRQRFKYSDHARDQMDRRQISEDDVEYVHLYADTTFPGTDRKGRNLVKEGFAPDGRRLCVVVKKLRPTIIVSAYWR
jgi:hypothetical protein